MAIVNAVCETAGVPVTRRQAVNDRCDAVVAKILDEWLRGNTCMPWVFEQYGQYFMVGIEPNCRIRTDGGHSQPADVAQARKLHESIDVIRPPEGTKWAMVKIDRIPEFDGKLTP